MFLESGKVGQGGRGMGLTAQVSRPELLMVVKPRVGTGVRNLGPWKVTCFAFGSHAVPFHPAGEAGMGFSQQDPLPPEGPASGFEGWPSAQAHPCGLDD